MREEYERSTRGVREEEKKFCSLLAVYRGFGLRPEYERSTRGVREEYERKKNQCNSNTSAEQKQPTRENKSTGKTLMVKCRFRFGTKLSSQGRVIDHDRSRSITINHDSMDLYVGVTQASSSRQEEPNQSSAKRFLERKLLGLPSL